MHLLRDMYCKLNTKLKYLLKGQKRELQRNPDPNCSIHSAASFLGPTIKMQMNAKIKSTSHITCVALREWWLMLLDVRSCGEKSSKKSESAGFVGTVDVCTINHKKMPYNLFSSEPK